MKSKKLNAKTMKAQIKNPDTREEALTSLAEWIKDACLFFGTTTSTAYRVAGIFAAGLADDIPVDDRYY